MSSSIVTIPIGKLIEKVVSWNPPRDAPDDELNYIDLSSVDNNTKQITTNQTIKGSEAPSRARQKVKVGDILVSTVRPNLNGVARVPEHLDGATASTGFCVLRPNTEKLDASYLFHWLQSSEFVEDMVRKATGASYPAVSDKIIAHSEIPLPPLDEQKRIAAILDQADELRRKRQRALDRLNQLGQAIFHEMFGDLELNSNSFPIVKLSELVSLQGGYAFKSANYKTSGIPVVRIGEVNTEFKKNTVFYPLDEKLFKYILKPGELVLSLTGTVGKDDYCNIAKVPNLYSHYYLNQRVARVSVNSDVANASFVMRLFSLPHIKSQAIKNNRGIRQANLSNSDIYQIDVPLPPLNIQQEFSQRQLQIEESISEFKDSSFLLDRLFASIQNRAFQGEL